MHRRFGLVFSKGNPARTRYFSRYAKWGVSLFANLFLTLGIGMAEEIFFRGIIFGLWRKHGTIKAMILSSVLFGLSHLLNIAGGAEFGETILQICFALVYGMVFALVFGEGQPSAACAVYMGGLDNAGKKKTRETVIGLSYIYVQKMTIK